MSVKPEDMTIDALKDLARVRQLGEHNDMTQDELLDALDGPVDDDLARWLGKTRSKIYEAAQDAGVENPKDKDKRELIEALVAKS